MKAYISGNSTKRHGNYLPWEVRDHETDEVLCVFYGPMSCSAAATFCTALNAGSQLPPADAVRLTKTQASGK